MIIHELPENAIQRCHANDGRALSRGVSAGVRLLADALARGDLRGARELIEWAERRANEEMAA